MGIGLCTVLWVCRPKCHCKASESSEVPPLQRLLMHNAEWQTIKSVFGGKFIHFGMSGFIADIQKCVPCLYISTVFLFPHCFSIGTACVPPPTCWVTQSGLALWSTFPTESCRIRMPRCATLWLKRMRSPTSLSARKTIQSITTTVRPQCEDKGYTLKGLHVPKAF